MVFLAVFGIKDSGLNLVVSLLLLMAVAVWVALIFWTYSDAKRRLDDGLLIGCATVAAVFPFVGTAIYMIVRPPDYMEDVRERELEIRAAEARLQEAALNSCRFCDYPVDKDYLICPNCMRQLREKCSSCTRALELEWTMCPYCTTQVTQQPQATIR